MKVGKTFHISYAHALAGHPGKCRSLHGHNARIEVELEGEVDLISGMVADFEEIVEGIGDRVKRDLDHKLILHSKDFLNRFHQLGDTEEVVLLRFPPTAEILASLVRFWTKMRFPENQITVRFWETDTSFAECRQYEVFHEHIEEGF